MAGYRDEILSLVAKEPDNGDGFAGLAETGLAIATIFVAYVGGRPARPPIG